MCMQTVPPQSPRARWPQAAPQAAHPVPGGVPRTDAGGRAICRPISPQKIQKGKIHRKKVRKMLIMQLAFSPPAYEQRRAAPVHTGHRPTFATISAGQRGQNDRFFEECRSAGEPEPLGGRCCVDAKWFLNFWAQKVGREQPASSVCPWKKVNVPGEKESAG